MLKLAEKQQITDSQAYNIIKKQSHFLQSNHFFNIKFKNQILTVLYKIYKTSKFLILKVNRTGFRMKQVQICLQDIRYEHQDDLII